MPSEVTTQQAIVQWKGEPVTVTFQDVKTLLCPLATDQEVAIFLKTCQSLQLNPFANEIYLIKYAPGDKAATVIAIESYLKAAETSPQYDGCEAGVIMKNGTGGLEFREGAFILDEEKDKLAGGWARVYRKDRQHPTYVAVNKNECIKLTREGKLTKFWTEEKQPWMLRKTALKRGCLESFPSLFAGTLASAEIEGDIEGTLPAAFEKANGPDWAKFWTKVQFELGITSEEAHKLLGVQSTKELLSEGQTLETVWKRLVKAVQDKGQRPQTDLIWLKESLSEMHWTSAGKWLLEQCPEAKGESIKDIFLSLTPEHQQAFVQEVQNRLEMQWQQK